MQDLIKNYITGLGSTIGVFGFFYAIIWRVFAKQLRKRKVQTSLRAGWEQIKRELGDTFIALLGTTVFTTLLLSLKDNGLTQFYTQVGMYGRWYEIAVIVLMVVLSDTWFYRSHRIMHHPRIYKYVHALHHLSLDVNPFTSTSFHMIEAVWLTVWVLPFIMFIPISPFALGVVQILGQFNNLKSHLGYELYPQFFTYRPFKYLVTATNHSLHHTEYNGNYGLFFRFWDMRCGTEIEHTTKSFEDIHHRKEITIHKNTTFAPLTISKIEKETHDTVSVYFSTENKEFYDYLPGQYVTLKMKVKGIKYYRYFSLSSSPHTDDYLRITVKIKGSVSQHLFHNAKVGDSVLALLPEGEFIVTLQADQKKNYVMVAGGSGITAIWSMVKSILHTEPASTVKLLYACKSTDDIILHNEIENIAKTHPALEVHYLTSGERRLGRNDLVVEKNTQYYICGPETLKKAAEGYCKELGISPNNIHTENYADGYIPWFGVFSR